MIGRSGYATYDLVAAGREVMAAHHTCGALDYLLGECLRRQVAEFELACVRRPESGEQRPLLW